MTNLNTNATPTLLDLDSMMDETMDNIQAAPDFSNPPAGEYRLQTKSCAVDTYKAKAKNGIPEHDAKHIKIVYAVAQTKSVATGEQPVPNGTMFSETFMATDMGLGYFFARVKGIMNVSDISGIPLRDKMSSIVGQEFDARITIKRTPNPAGGEYENVQIRVIPPAA